MAKNTNNGATLGFESELWRAADALRSNMDAAEYKHVVLGLIFLKYAWRGDVGANLRVRPHPDDHPQTGQPHRVAPTEYRDIPGFCKSVTIEDIRKHGYVLTPGRYMGAAPQEEDDEPFDQKMQRLVAQLREQQAEARRLDAAIAANLKELGYGG